MIQRFRCVSVAWCALLTTASACLAAEPAYAPRKGGIGGGLGYSKFIEDADFSEQARGRFSFSGSLRYVISPGFRWQVSPGFLWSAYAVGSRAPFRDPQFPADATKDQYLTLLAPVTAQLQVTERRGWWIYHLGAGPGIYRLWVENRRKVLQDPASHRRHRGQYMGVSAELGAERFLKGITTTSVEGVVGGHLVFAERDAQFPSGFNSNVLPLDFRLCVNYYFDLVKPKKSIESGVPPQP